MRIYQKMKIFENSTGSLLITLPSQIARLKGWKKGMLLQLRLEKGKLILEEVNKEEKKKNEKGT